MPILAKLHYQSGADFKLIKPRIVSSECSITGTEQYIFNKIEEIEGVIEFVINSLHSDWALDYIEYNKDAKHIEIRATLLNYDGLPEEHYTIYLFTEDVIKHFFNCVNIVKSIDTYLLDILKEAENLYLSIVDSDWVDEE